MGSGDPPLPRVFFDSGVIIEALLAPWSASRALLIFARTGAFKAVVAQDVREEVEDTLRDLLARSPARGSDAIGAYARLLRALDPEHVAPTAMEEIARSRHLIRHEADVPILVAALKAAPDWLLTTNTRHFTPAVNARTGLKICAPKQFIRCLRVA